jgi:hypothetical protein
LVRIAVTPQRGSRPGAHVPQESDGRLDGRDSRPDRSELAPEFIFGTRSNLAPPRRD